MEQNAHSTPAEAPKDLLATVQRDLDRASAMDDATRLKTLEELYKMMESELEGDFDQAGPARH